MKAARRVLELSWVKLFLTFFVDGDLDGVFSTCLLISRSFVLGNLVNILFRECTYFFGEGLFKVTVRFEGVNVFTFGSCSVLGL